MERYVGSSLWKEVFALSYVYNKVDTKSDFSPQLPTQKAASSSLNPSQMKSNKCIYSSIQKNDQKARGKRNAS